MMDQKKSQKKNKSLRFSNYMTLHLSIQISLDGFSFCLINKAEQKIEQLKHFDFEHKTDSAQLLLTNIQNVFRNEPLLQKRYPSVNINHFNQYSSLVPKPLFDKEHIKDYIRYSTKTYQNDYIVYDEIEGHQLINVYIPFVNVNNFFLERFGSFEYKHSSTILISTLLNTYKYSEHPHMFAHIDRHHFELVVIAQSQLLLYNSFTYETKEDFIYYILFTAEQLKLDVNTLDLVLSGLISDEGELFEIAYTYVRKVSLLENRSSYQFDPKIDETDKRRHLVLLNQFG